MTPLCVWCMFVGMGACCLFLALFSSFVFNSYELQVRTFDAKEFAYEPSECWNAMSFDVSHLQRGAILVRYTGQWEVRIIWHMEGLVFDISPTNFLVSFVDIINMNFFLLSHQCTYSILVQ